MESPGTGVQQRANFTYTSPIPATSMELLERLAVCTPVGKTGTVASGCESSSPIEAINFSIIEADET